MKQTFLFLFFFFFSFTLFSETLLININQSNQKQLMLLKGIGKVRSQRIIDSRNQTGLFQYKKELLSRKLIPESIFKRIQNQITLDGENQLPFDSKQNLLQILSENQFSGKWWLLTDKNLFPVLIDKIQKAKKKIWVTSFVFKTSNYEKNKANLILNALLEAQKRDIQVVVILEYALKNLNLNQTNGNTLQRLRQGGIEVKLDSPDQTLHSKLAVIDGTWSFIGSHNLTHSALGKNREVSVLFQSKPLAKKIEHYIQQL